MFGIDAVIIGKILGVAAIAAWEYWLGKTDKVKAASTVELIGDGIRAAFKSKDKK